MPKGYIARKASMILIWAKFQQQNGCRITSLMLNGIILLKRLFYIPYHSSQGFGM